jgi:hypothetical protein
MDAKGHIEAGRYTCIGLRGESLCFALRGSGIRPLILLLDTDPNLLQGVALTDKLIGKAAAMVAVLGGVQSVWGQTMSDSAIAYLTEQGIPHSYEKRVAHILNRQGDGICPLEAVALPLDHPRKAYQALKARIAQLMAGQ